MKHFGTKALVALGLGTQLWCSAVFAQTNRLDDAEVSSRSGLTGTGAGSGETTAATGRVDVLGNPLLGGERHPLYRLQPSDVVEVTFTLSPEFDQKLTVQPDGYVSLKDATAIYVQGLTLDELRDAIGQAYRGYLHEPQIAVALKEFEHPYFVVGGEVGRPGKYELRSDVTVVEAIQMAGGFTAQAKHSQVILFRRVNDALTETRLLNLKRMLKNNKLAEDAHLCPGDFVFVPQNAVSKITRFLPKPSMGVYANSSQF